MTDGSIAVSSALMPARLSRRLLRGHGIPIGPRANKASTPLSVLVARSPLFVGEFSARDSSPALGA
jgi:hypothetical protein